MTHQTICSFPSESVVRGGVILYNGRKPEKHKKVAQNRKKRKHILWKTGKEKWWSWSPENRKKAMKSQKTIKFSTESRKRTPYNPPSSKHEGCEYKARIQLNTYLCDIRNIRDQVHNRPLWIYVTRRCEPLYSIQSYNIIRFHRWQRWLCYTRIRAWVSSG